MSRWAELSFKKGDGSEALNGDEFFDALHAAVEAVRKCEPEDSENVFRAGEHCIDAGEDLLKARLALEGQA